MNQETFITISSSVWWFLFGWGLKAFVESDKHEAGVCFLLSVTILALIAVSEFFECKRRDPDA